MNTKVYILEGIILSVHTFRNARTPKDTSTRANAYICIQTTRTFKHTRMPAHTNTLIHALKGTHAILCTRINAQTRSRKQNYTRTLTCVRANAQIQVNKHADADARTDERAQTDTHTRANEAGARSYLINTLHLLHHGSLCDGSSLCCAELRRDGLCYAVLRRAKLCCAALLSDKRPGAACVQRWRSTSRGRTSTRTSAERE